MATISPDPEASSNRGGKLGQRDDLSALLARARTTARQAAGRAASAEDRSDLAQSVVRELLRHAGRLEYRGVEAFDGLVRTLFAHKLRSKLARARAAKRDVRREVSAPTDDESNLAVPDRDPDHDPVQGAVARDLHARLMDLIDRLPARAREVIMLRAAGCTSTEVARRLAISEDNAQKIYTRTRTELEAALLDGERP